MPYLSTKAQKLVADARYYAESVAAGDRVGDIVDKLAATMIALADDVDAHRRTPETGPPKPPALGADDPVPASRLVPGLEVQRRTDPVRGRRLASETPCCDKRLVFDIQPDIDIDNPEALAGLRMCRCRRLWTVLADPDVDGGHWAYWTLAGLAR